MFVEDRTNTVQTVTRIRRNVGYAPLQGYLSNTVFVRLMLSTQEKQENTKIIDKYIKII
jgi:hypothetical protein